MFDLFDLHSDTATEIFAGGKELKNNDLNISLSQRKGIGRYIQTFAFWTQNDDDRSARRFDAFSATYSYFMKECIKNSDEVAVISDKADLGKAAESGKTGVLLAVEGGGVLEGDPAKVEKLKKCGIKLLTLTWNKANELSGGVLDENQSGLTSVGREVISEMERLGITLDVSHISDKGFEDVCGLVKKPFIATHSNSRAVCPHPRNLTDDMFREIVRRGGLVGINLFNKFLTKDGVADADCICRHIERFLKLGGEKSIAMGTDFDGVDNDLPDGISGLKDMYKLSDALVARFGSETASDIMFRNAYGFFNSIL